MRLLFPCLCAWVLFPGFSSAQSKIDHKKAETGVVSFDPKGDQRNIPECYRLQPHKFDFTLTWKQDFALSGFELYELSFPSPVKSPHVENNTVYAAYYRPKGKERFPCVIVLDITAGDQAVSRMISAHLAQNGIGALFVQMAYYGPRRPAGSKARLLSTNVEQSMKAVRQTVLDLRRAAAWMASRPEIDADNLGIVGTSLGGFMAALTAEMEPKLSRVAILLAGGGFIDVFYDDPRAAPYRTIWEAVGGTKEQARKFFAPYDPLTCAANLKNRKLLMISAKHDEIVPPRMAEALWKASGQQKIVWLNSGHYTAALYVVPGLTMIVEHFRVE